MTERTALVLPPDGIAWSVLVTAGDDVLLEHEPDRELSGASLGKLLLLVEVAERVVAAELPPGELLRRTPDDLVTDSGLWQQLLVDELAVLDIALLVGSVSDNLATNVLVREVGLEAVADRGRRLGLRRTVLHDRVRDVRGPRHPPRLSTVTARELVLLMAAVSSGAHPALSSEAAALVRRWLTAGCDLSMVAAAFGLDPLAHRDLDRGMWLLNKTGTDSTVRGDAGVVTRQDTGEQVTYAVVAEWEPTGPDRRDDVLAAMRSIGAQVLAALRPAG